MISILALITCALLANNLARAADQDCSYRSDAETGYKASWVYDAQNKRVQFSIEAKQSAPDNTWTGIGFGRTMSNGDMIIVTNSGGRVSATDRHGTGYVEPAIDAQQDVQNFAGRFENGIIYATFNRLVNTNDREDRPLEDPSLNGCQYFMFPITGGRTNGQGGLERHIATPTPKLICNITRCTTGAAPEGRQQQSPPPATSAPALANSNNNGVDQEIARDAVTAPRNQSSPKPQAAPGAPVAAAGAAAPQPGQGAAGAGEAGSPAVGPSAPGAAGGAAGAAAGGETSPACEYVDGKYKVQWYYTEVTKRLTFTVDAPLAPNRWTGLGFGQQMLNGDMIIIQDNNGVKASDRHGTGHVEPAVDAHQDIEAFKGTVDAGILHATFNRLLNTNDKEDLPIDDEAQNNCQYFIFPVAGGNADGSGKIQIHESTPKVKLICNAKTCKKPAETPLATGGGEEGEDGGDVGGPALGAAGTTGSAKPAGSVTPAPGAGQTQAAGGVGSETPGAVGGRQPGATGAQPIGGTAIGAQPNGGQPASNPAQPGTPIAAGAQPNAGGPSGAQSGVEGVPAGGATGAAGNPGAGAGGAATTSGQPGGDGGAAAPAAGAGGIGAPSRPCPSRKDHHLCGQYVDDYLSVVYSRFPKTDVITNKACGLLSTTQEGVVIRECCHYLSTHCGRFLDQYLSGLGVDNGAATATPASGPFSAAGAPNVASNGAASPVAANPTSGGAIGGSSPNPTTEEEEEETTSASNPGAGRNPASQPPTAVAGANPGPPVANNSQNVAGGPNPANPNPSAASAPNPNGAPPPPVATAGGRGPEVQPGAAPSSTNPQNPSPSNPSPATPDSPEPKSGASPQGTAPKSPLPNDPSQPDAGGKPGAKP